MTLGIVYRNEEEFNGWLKEQHAQASAMLVEMGLNPTELLATEVGWLLCAGRYENRPLRFDLFQLGFLLCQNRMRSMNKARQVGFSFGIACEAIARCHLKEKHTAVCVSYNLDDAKEKIQRVKELHDELPLEFQKRIAIDSKTEVAFESRGSKRRLSKVVSLPAKAPRGKTGDVYLDELAHCQTDRSIYAGATALISRSGGQLTVGSTPLGQRGQFHAIHTQAFDRYPGFARFNVPWWRCSHFSTISKNAELCQLASTLPTEVRVERYGTSALRDQFLALPLEDFQQEFELAFQDERVSFFPYDLILPCCLKEAYQVPVYDNLEQFAAVAPKLGPLYMGFDVGRSKNPSELFAFEKQGEDYVIRYKEQFRDMPFPKQRARLKQVCRVLGEHWKKFRIDATGFGKNLAEDLQATFGSRRVEQVTFTNAIKEDLANSMKILMQERKLVLFKDRGLIAQIHSVKQKFTVTGNAIFDVERNRRHHADQMWAIALAVFQKRRMRRPAEPVDVGIRMLGDQEIEERDEQAEVERARERSRPKGRTFVERLFDVPEEKTVVLKQPDLKPLTVDQLEDRSKTLRTAIKVWKREGDPEKAQQLELQYKNVRKRIARLKRKARLAPA